MSVMNPEALLQGDRVHRRVYTDPDIFGLELERIFGRVWLYVGHASQLPGPGDFIRTRLGRHEVLLVRAEDDSLHALRNSCAHRGARLCAEKRGTARRLVCPYHAWSYRLDGSLATVPHRRSYGAALDLDDPANWLARAPRVESYRGFVFASWAERGPGLTEYLGPMTEAIDNLIERAPDGEVELAGGGFRLLYPGNWKLHMENANDTVHPSFVHASSVASARGAGDDSQTRQMLAGNAFGEREWDSVALCATPGGHSYMGGFYRNGLIAPGADDPASREYRRRLAGRLGRDGSEAVLGVDRFNNLIYPNLSINAQYQQLRVVQPLAVDRSLVQAWCFRLGGAPPEIFRRAVRFLSTLSSPASMIFADDVEIFRRCQQGLSDGGIDWLNVARGRLGDTLLDDGSRHSDGASELPVRAQLRAWQTYMSLTDGSS